MKIRRKTYKTRVSAITQKSPYDLVGGPLDGVRVWLSSPSTLPLSCRGQRGVYLDDAAVARGAALRWVPADHA